MAVQRGRSERRGESYSGPYLEPLSDATCLREALRQRQGTPLADCFSILLVVQRAVFNNLRSAQDPRGRFFQIVHVSFRLF
jgi:hypothetical protein